MSEVPEPLVDADVDLRDFTFMPLDVLRLRDSGLTAKASGDEFRAAVLLWCASWHQVPAASLPDDDAELASLCGYGRAPKEWKKIRPGALRGWVMCTDGRLYHPVVAAKARESWLSKLRQRWMTECSRVKKHNQRHGTSLVVPEFDMWLSLGCPQGQPLPVPGDKPPLSPECPDDLHSKGQGEGQGQGQGRKKTVVAADATTSPPEPPASPPLKTRDLVAEGVEAQAAADWLTLRKAKRLPLTATAWADTKAEGAKRGLSPGQTVAKAVANNWAGFKASWPDPGAGGRPGSPVQTDVFAGAL